MTHLFGHNTEPHVKGSPENPEKGGESRGNPQRNVTQDVT